MKNVTKFTPSVQKELNNNIEIASLISMILGSISLLAYIILGVVIDSEPFWLNFLLFPGAVFFGFGLVFYFFIKKTNKSVDIEEIENVYDFCDDFFIIESFKKGEQIATVKTYYNEIRKYKESKNYLFIMINQYNSYPVDKNNFLQDEIDLLKTKIKQGIKERKSNPQ